MVISGDQKKHKKNMYKEIKTRKFKINNCVDKLNEKKNIKLWRK